MSIYKKYYRVTSGSMMDLAKSLSEERKKAIQALTEFIKEIAEINAAIDAARQEGGA